MKDKDTIYRQDAIEAMAEELLIFPIGLTEAYDMAENAMSGLPSAEPRKKGKWIYGEKSGQDGWYCSECGGFIPWYYDFYGLDNIDFIEDFKTCPFCDSKMVSYTGADMREELKLCPFCGKYPQTVVDDETEEKFGVKCFNCGGSIYPEKATLQEAIEAWNKRAGEEE